MIGVELHARRRIFCSRDTNKSCSFAAAALETNRDGPSNGKRNGSSFGGLIIQAQISGPIVLINENFQFASSLSSFFFFINIEQRKYHIHVSPTH
jgi:hypothetical protein